MEELIVMLNNIPASYYDFVIGISNYAKKKPERMQKVKDFIKEHPDATCSDVTYFVMTQQDFFEDDVRNQKTEMVV